MKTIFYNLNEKRLRAGWRILFFLIIFFSFSSAIFIIRPLLGDIGKREFLENYSLIIVSILALGATISVLLARKWFDKKSFMSLGIRWSRQAFKDLIFGFFLSGVMVLLFFGILIISGLIEFTGFNFHESNFQQLSNGEFVDFISVLSLGSLGLIFLEHVLVGYWEELVFRGYLFQNMIQGLGILMAIVISCLLYGLIHAANPNATYLSSLIIIAFGFLRIYGYLCTKMLWLSIGMHIGWNFFQGPIFGFAASGHKKATLFQHHFTSDQEFLTGAAFGPEGSILIIPILVVALLAMKKYSKVSYPKNFNPKTIYT